MPCVPCLIIAQQIVATRYACWGMPDHLAQTSVSHNDRTELVRQLIAAERLGRTVYQRPRPLCITFASVSEKHIWSLVGQSMHPSEVW